MAKKINKLAEELEVSVVSNLSGEFTTYEELLAQGHPTFPDGQTREKYNAEREEKIFQGAESLRKLMPDVDEAVIQLAIWWENKHARQIIKQKLTEDHKGLFTDFTQTKLCELTENLSSLSELISRLSYIVTYFKPRETKAKIDVQINGEIFTLKKTDLERIKEELGNDREAMIAEVKKCAVCRFTPQTIEL